MHHTPIHRTRAQESRAAIERLYIAMRHLFIRGAYKPLGVSGEAIKEALSKLAPEIYGDINDKERVELDGLLYIFQRLPRGIEECRFIKMVSREGFENSEFTPIIAPKRRRDSYRIDQDRMYIEMTRGRSDIYDILTHLTFMYIEAEKILRNSEDAKGRKRAEWEKLKDIVEKSEANEAFNQEIAYTYLSTLIGRTYEETAQVCERFEQAEGVNSFFHIVYWLGYHATREKVDQLDREISFSKALREKIGHHAYGEQWAGRIKSYLAQQDWLDRPIHIISANLHSVVNTLYAQTALASSRETTIESTAAKLSQSENRPLRKKVFNYALKNGLHELSDVSGTNIGVQVIDTAALSEDVLPRFFKGVSISTDQAPVIVIMDYAFGEQAFETMDELLKPLESANGKTSLNVQSVNIMGKAGILHGGKGDIMIPTAHVFEGTADNYPFENELTAEDFKPFDIPCLTGPMITVMGTSLQNRDILRYFAHSSWGAIGLEMEGAHYQKAIQSAAKIRKNISTDVVLRYAYYASDNPLESGQTLASGSLGLDGVKPTYAITSVMLRKIFMQF